MNHASTPRWNIIVFAFAMIVIAIVITGSLFIMYTADQRMMPGMAASMNTSPHTVWMVSAKSAGTAFLPGLKLRFQRLNESFVVFRYIIIQVLMDRR